MTPAPIKPEATVADLEKLDIRVGFVRSLRHARTFAGRGE